MVRPVRDERRGTGLLSTCAVACASRKPRQPASVDNAFSSAALRTVLGPRSYCTVPETDPPGRSTRTADMLARTSPATRRIRCPAGGVARYTTSRGGCPLEPANRSRQHGCQNLTATEHPKSPGWLADSYPARTRTCRLTAIMLLPIRSTGQKAGVLRSQYPVVDKCTTTGDPCSGKLKRCPRTDAKKMR